MASTSPRSPSTDVMAPRDAPRVPEVLRLHVSDGPDRGRELVLERGTYCVGKDGACELVLSDRAVSRRHLELVVRSDGILVRDLASRNGSFFQGARFTEITVGAGAKLTIGATVLQLAAPERAAPLDASPRERFGPLWGRSRAMREVFAVLERIAGSDAPVLVEGETGTGKELVAEALHAASGRAGPLVVCDVAGISRGLIESELFGHKKGAFTGADRDRDGAFTEAYRGTLFIDELGELELALQPRLLRAIAQRKVKPVGDSHYRDVDVRVIAATNRDLADGVARGTFREDLYYRLAVLQVRLPPLRERKEDLPLLVARMLDGRDARIADEAMALLAEYDWPGNVRELRNVIDRGLSLVGPGRDRVLTPRLLGLDDSAAPRGVAESYHEARERLLAAWERQYVTDLLRSAAGNVSRAARVSGLGRPYLYRLLKKHGLFDGKRDPEP